MRSYVYVEIQNNALTRAILQETPKRTTCTNQTVHTFNCYEIYDGIIYNPPAICALLKQEAPAAIVLSLPGLAEHPEKIQRFRLLNALIPFQRAGIRVQRVIDTSLLAASTTTEHYDYLSLFRRPQKSYAAWWLSGTGLCGAALALCLWFHTSAAVTSVRHLSTQHDTLSAHIAQLSEEAGPLAHLTETRRQLSLHHTKRLKHAERAYTYQEILKYIAQAIPPHTVLERLTVGKQGTELHGYSLKLKEVPHFIEQISQAAPFKGVYLDHLEKKESSSYVMYKFCIKSGISLVAASNTKAESSAATVASR